MRIYNPSLGRFLSVDPLTAKYAYLTPYQFASNRPIDGTDLDGEEYFCAIIAKYDGNGKATYSHLFSFKESLNGSYYSLTTVRKGKINTTFVSRAVFYKVAENIGYSHHNFPIRTPGEALDDYVLLKTFPNLLTIQTKEKGSGEQTAVDPWNLHALNGATNPIQSPNAPGPTPTNPDQNGPILEGYVPSEFSKSKFTPTVQDKDGFWQLEDGTWEKSFDLGKLYKNKEGTDTTVKWKASTGSKNWASLSDKEKKEVQSWTPVNAKKESDQQGATSPPGTN